MAVVKSPLYGQTNTCHNPVDDLGAPHPSGFTLTGALLLH